MKSPQPMLVHSRRRCAAVQCGSRIRVRRRAERTQEHEQGRRGGGAARVEQELGRGAARRGRNQQGRHHARTQSIPSLPANPTFPSQPAPAPSAHLHKNPPRIQLALDRVLGSSPEPPPRPRSEFPASACTDEVQNWPSPVLANCAPTQRNRRGGREFLWQVCW